MKLLVRRLGRRPVRGSRRIAAAFTSWAVLGLAAAGPAAIGAPAPRLEVIDVPSAKGNVDLAVTRLNGAADRLQMTVMLPAGYDDEPQRRWPVLYLLHGVDDGHSTWADHRFGDISARAAGLGAIIVMPEGGRGYFTDQWLGGKRRGGNWERYFLEEVIPAAEARYRIAPGRENHAIAGNSMGAYGAMILAAQLPSYFGSAVAQSGLFDLGEWTSRNVVPFFSKFSFTRQWGPPGGPYMQAHNPIRLTTNLQRTRLLVSTGTGATDARRPFDIMHATAGAAIEVSSWWQSHRFVAAARRNGVPAKLSVWTGVHDWVYWRRDLDRVFRWGLFGTDVTGVHGGATRFTYRTMAPAGNAWGLGFRFSALPTQALQLQRAGDVISATGRGTLTITPGAAADDATGAGTRPDCAFTAELPFEYRLPAGCGATTP